MLSAVSLIRYPYLEDYPPVKTGADGTNKASLFWVNLLTAVLHTWGSALTHHPHVHMIVPSGGLSEDGGRWISSRHQTLLLRGGRHPRASRRALAPLSNRKFVDSPLEETGFEPSVPAYKDAAFSRSPRSPNRLW
jgi:hypothetical protein